jgi:Domain of unknown function (DUF4282)
VTDVVRTCANCGNVQTSGDFCEKCGTRMPPAMAAASSAAAYQTAPPVTPPPAQPSYSQQAGYGATYGAQPGYSAPPAGQYGYAPPEEAYRRRESGGWSKLFDSSFQGFVTPATLRAVYWIVLGLICLYVLFNIILVAMAGNRFTIIAFFISLFAAALWFFIARVFFELVATVMRMRNKE